MTCAPSRRARPPPPPPPPPTHTHTRGSRYRGLVLPEGGRQVGQPPGWGQRRVVIGVEQGRGAEGEADAVPAHAHILLHTWRRGERAA